MPISFQPSEEQQLVQDTARKLADERLWPQMRETEKARALSDAVKKEAHELGLTAVALPESAGGAGLGLVTACLVEEELARGDAAACWALGGAGTLGSFVLELGTVEQHNELLARFTKASAVDVRGAVAWSEAKPANREGFAATAARSGDNWIIDAEKAFVVNGGAADLYVVVAQTNGNAGWKGLDAFAVEASAKGVKPGPRRKLLGLDAAIVADVTFDTVRVPESARLAAGGDVPSALARAFARHALISAARAVGLAGRAWQLTRDYTAERKAFGKPIGHFQAVAFNVADRLMDVESARWLVWKAAAGWDHDGKPRLSDVAAAGAHALEVVMRCTDDAVQLHGGAGFIRDYAVEKLFRDARQLTLMGPSVAALDQMLADQALGRPIDPGAILPTPDVQPVCI